jgi:hypothetical protein
MAPNFQKKEESSMKGINGLILAIVLGIAGALFNWAYLANRTSDKVNVYFIGIKRDVTLNSGDVIKAEQIERVGLPQDAVGNLKNFAVFFDGANAEMQSVVGVKVWRVIQGPRLLLNDDLKTPPPELRLEEGEEAMFVPIDTRSIVMSLIEPGDQVMFLVSKSAPGVPTPATPAARAAPAAVGDPIPEAANADESSSAEPPPPIELIGPFKVLSLGNRLGSAEVMKSARIPQVQENVMTISVKAKDNAKALKLQSRLDATNYRQVGVRLVSRKEK